MKITSIYPFTDYTVYKVFHKKQGRYYAQLINKLDKTRTTITYAKYLLSIKLGRILSREEEVDHKDNNKLNDDIDNLHILSTEDNKQKWIDDPNRKRHRIMKLTCRYCEVEFEREERQVLFKKSSNYFCSKEHSREWSKFR